MTNPLSAAELAIYAILSIPVIFILIRHLPTGALGWGYLVAFCTLRIIGGALSVNSNKPSASIISSVGLSPLLLAASGILHEARTYRSSNIDRKVEWMLVLFFHVLVAGGVALLAAGASSLQSSHPMANALTLVKAGVSILAVSWGVLVIWAAVSVTPSQHSKSAVAHREGSILLYSVCFSLVFIAIRVFYSVAALTSGKASLNPLTGSLAVRVVLGFISELIAVLAFVLAGLRTRHISRTLRGDAPRQNYSGGSSEPLHRRDARRGRVSV